MRTLFRRVLHEDAYTIAGECRQCGAVLVVTRDHDGQGEVTQEMYDAACALKPNAPIRYSGRDRRPHAPHEYLHVDDWDTVRC